MKRGDKVIYSHSYNSNRKQPHVGYFLHCFGIEEPALLIGESPDATYGKHVHTAHVRPYSEALWTAWQQWLRNEELLAEQHKKLVAGRMPEELLTIGMW